MSDFWQAVEFSHMLLKKHIKKNSFVVDATVGNGHDTVFLANLVGEDGQVISFDIQKAAIKNTKLRLLEKNLTNRVRLIEDGHQNLALYINENEGIDGMIFNLGYLPGGNKEIITQKTTTITAIKSGLKLLKTGGIIVLVIYTGHPGGKEEFQGVLELLKTIDSYRYNTLRYNFINQEASPQVLAVIRRR